MEINNVERVIVNNNVLHHSELLGYVLAFKKQLAANAVSSSPFSAEAQEQFNYAVISTQDFSIYYICVIRLPHKPSEIWQDVNNIPELKKKQDLLSQLRVAAACFALLLIQSRTIAEKGDLLPTNVDVMSEQTEQDTLLLLQYLNKSDSTLPSYWSRMTEDGVYLGQTELSGMQPYIPVLSPLQLQNKRTIQIPPSTGLTIQPQETSYIELLKGLEHLSYNPLAKHREALKEYQGSYSLHYYPAITPIDDTHNIYLVLSHLAPMEILYSINMDKMEELSKEEADVVQFIKHFVTTKNALQSLLARHGIENLLTTCRTHNRHNEAVNIFHNSAPATVYEHKTREALAFAVNSIAYIPSPQDFTAASSSVKILYTQQLCRSINLNEFFNKIQAIRSYTQHILNDSKKFQHPCYFYLGISQEFTGAFHLLLIISQKKPNALVANRNNIDSLPLIEQNVLHFASALQQIEKIVLRTTAFPHASNDLANCMNLLNTPIPRQFCKNPSQIETSVHVPLSICTHFLSELDLANKDFITHIDAAPHAFSIETFEHINLLTALNYMAYAIENHLFFGQHPTLNKTFYYYPCLGKKHQNIFHILMAISHKAPEEVINIQKQAIEKLSKEEQGILLCGNLYLESQKAASNGDEQCQVLKDAKYSEDDFMNFLRLLNNQLKRDKLDSEMDDAAEKIIYFKIADIAPLIPFLPANRLEAYDALPSSSSASTPPNPKRRRTQLNDTRDLQPPRILYQNL